MTDSAAVVIPRAACTSLQAAHRSLTDGTEQPTNVKIRVFGFVPPPAITLAVDEATARQLRRSTVSYRLEIAATLLMMVPALALIGHWILGVTGHLDNSRSITFAIGCFAVAIACGAAALVFRKRSATARPAQYPHRVGNDVVVSNLDERAANAWAETNAGLGVVCLPDRT